MKYEISFTSFIHLIFPTSFVVSVFAIISIHGYRKYSSKHYSTIFQIFSSRIITHDDSLAYEVKHAFRYLLATVLRRIQQVRPTPWDIHSKRFYSSRLI